MLLEIPAAALDSKSKTPTATEVDRLARSRTLVARLVRFFPVEPDGLGSITVTETSLSPNLVGVYVATARPTDVQSCKEHLTVGHVGRRIAACWRPLNGHSVRPKPLGTSRNGGSAARQRRLGGDG